MTARKKHPQGDLPEDLALTYLEYGIDLFDWKIPADHGRALWFQYREGIMKHYFAMKPPEGPCRRPWAFWMFEFPQHTLTGFPPRDFTLADLIGLGVELTPAEKELVKEKA